MEKYWLEQRRIARRRKEADVLLRQLTEHACTGRLGAALDAAGMLEQLQPRDGRWPRAMAELRRRMGHFHAAAEAYARAVERYVDAGEIHHALSAAKLLVLLEPSRTDALARIGGPDAEDLAQIHALQSTGRACRTPQGRFPPERVTQVHRLPEACIDQPRPRTSCEQGADL
jgi:hypothetical protein